MSDGKVRPQLEELMDDVDAAVFTGDGFHSAEGLARLRFYLKRWSGEADCIQRGIVEFTETPDASEPT